MATDARPGGRRRWAGPVAALALLLCLTACGTGPLVGLVYTRVKLPLTRDLQVTPLPPHAPHSDQVIEIKEPFSGLGLYARVSGNAIGEIARRNGVERLYFADQEFFSVLGIWKTQRVILYGAPADESPAGPEGAGIRE